MTLRFLAAAGGLLALVVVGLAARFFRARSAQISTEQLSGDWLAQARAREEEPW